MKRSEIEKLLPTVIRRTIRRDNPSVAILEVMSAPARTFEALIARLDSIFNPFRTPDSFVPFLARWLDLERIFDVAGAPASNAIADLDRAWLSARLDRIRILPFAMAWHEKGLDHFLEIAIGTQGVIIEEQVIGEDGAPIPFHLRVIAPDSTKPHRSLIERIVESEKPDM